MNRRRFLKLLGFIPLLDPRQFIGRLKLEPVWEGYVKKVIVVANAMTGAAKVNSTWIDLGQPGHRPEDMEAYVRYKWGLDKWRTWGVWTPGGPTAITMNGKVVYFGPEEGSCEG